MKNMDLDPGYYTILNVYEKDKYKVILNYHGPLNELLRYRNGEQITWERDEALNWGNIRVLKTNEFLFKNKDEWASFLEELLKDNEIKVINKKTVNWNLNVEYPLGRND